MRHPRSETLRFAVEQGPPILGVLLLFILWATFRKALCCIRDNHLVNDQQRVRKRTR